MMYFTFLIGVQEGSENRGRKASEFCDANFRAGWAAEPFYAPTHQHLESAIELVRVNSPGLDK